MDNPPATNIHTIVKAQIVFLLSTLTEENFERNQMEIRSLSEQHGTDTYIHFIRRLIVHSQARLLPSPPASAFDASTSLTFRLLVQETQRLARDPFLADRFREGVGGGEGESFRQFDFARFVDRVGLRPLERLVLAAAVVSGHTRKELANQAMTIIRSEFDNAMIELCQSPPLDHADFTQSQLTKLMSNLLSDVPPEAPILEPAQRQALVVAGQTKMGKEAMSPVLHRIFTKLSLQANTTLVDVLVQLGPDITSDLEVVRGLLERFGITESNPPRDAQVIDIISTLSRLATEGSMICDVGTFIRALVSYDVPLNWPSVIKSFDRPDRHGVDTATLKMLIAILLNSPRGAEPHAVTGFWQTWSNSLYQLRLLDALLSLPADTFNFVQLPGRRIVTVDDVSIASPTIKSLAANVQGQTWNSLELFQILVRLAGSDSMEIRHCVREMLDKAIKISAEIVHMGLLQVPDLPWNEIRVEYSRKLLAMFLAGHPNHQLVFMRIWQIDPSYLTTAFREFYEENPLNITRILDVAQDLKILDALLEDRPSTFTLDVAALASRREYLNLDKWLADNVASYGVEFLRAVIHFLEQKMESEIATRLSDPAVENRTMSLNPNTITIILRFLRNNSSLLDPNDVEACIEVRNTCLQVHPRLMTLIPNSDVESGLTVVQYSNEIEAEVDGIYKQMYDENTTIDEVISMLQRYKTSNNPRDHEVFSCMIHFLFDEYKFFQSYYPPRELAMTGYLFGSLIRHSLIEYIPLGIAMRYILDALKCSPDTNLFKFGLQALSRFEYRLAEWRPLCEALIRIPHLLEARPDLVPIIQRALNSSGGPSDHIPDSNVGSSNPTYEHASPFVAIQPDEITEPLEVPPEELSDRILFIVNNLAPNNFDSKVQEMREQFVDQYSRWFANYLVDQRISTEPNNHPLYLRFLDALDRQPLFKLILQETFVKAAALLNSDRSISGSDRNALKNVGTWLGTITLARDQPIKHKNLSFKDLLIEGYDSGRLIVAIPFVCKTLEPCVKSNVFKPPNPWLMAVISLLAELYHFAELKLNLKFDIEILCKSLELDLDTVEPTSILRNRPLESLAGLPLPDYPEDIGLLPIGGENPTGQVADSQVLALGAQSAESHRVLGAHMEAILSNLVHVVHISNQLAPLNVNPNFKRAVQHAVDRAVREIILPVVERSVTIAGISTRELVAKDFATEPNEEKLRRAGHLMAQKLAGSLALVTCKEPLKSNLATHLRQYLIDHGFNEQIVSDQLVTLLVQDNLDIACSAIEKAAMERAVSDVDEGFATSYDVRRRHRELHSAQAFWDPAVPVSNFTASLPDPLRIKPTGVQPHQFFVYEDFGSDPKRRIDSRPASVTSIHAAVQSYSQSPSVEHEFNHQRLHTHQEAMDRFSVLTRDLEAVMLQYPNQSLGSLAANHDIRHLVRQVVLVADDAADRERTPLMMSQKIVQLLYKTNSPLGREVYVALLDQLCRTFEDVAKEAITWLLYAEDERKFNVPVTVTLLRSGLINVTSQDQQLAKLLFEDPRPILLTFAANLVRECLSSDPPVATQNQFAYSIEIFSQLSLAGKANEEVNRLLDDLRGVRRTSVGAVPEEGFSTKSDEAMREKLFMCFQQWISIFQRSASPEKSFVPFITQLTKQGILKAEDASSFFFRVCTETSVNHFNKCAATGDYDYAFQAVDAMSRLIVYIIKYHGDASGINNDQAKIHYFKKILSIFVLVLSSQHENQTTFSQKPFFRFFSSLVNDLHSIENHLGPVYFQLLIVISDTYSSLQPIYFPGFAFSWMGLISHRLFMPKLLLSENREGWDAFHKLLLSLFNFLAPFMKDGDLQIAARDLYRGALRLLLVLLHDFPEFLSEYYFTLCDSIPPRCIQFRNIILSAFPPAIILPDPHLRNIKFDAIPEMGPIPPILSDFTSGLKSGDLRGYLDQYLLNRGTPSFLPSLKDRLRLKGDDGCESYNLSLINSLVMYIGVSSVAQAKARSGSSLFTPSDPGVVALQYLVLNLDVEGQHHLLSSMILHLRYPNAHTHWFSSLILHLFLEVNDERFREVVTKVLLERFIVHRPHPWGALVTFIELLRNPKYDFWSKKFIRIGPEVTLLLESVARSIFQQ
ncbi:Not1-domain-containing protein [Pholiota conissans]|uniref:General negative regulator of transcription subunit 1 n=1 Tax=Pholiota conissans TaxID=109636 RepID=A0A9P5YV28_9AGAR|nr:Not1-domain-containing protein [Pholiota conissans]